MSLNKKKKWTAEITLPEGVSGVLVWEGYADGFELTAGYQKITL
jgi:hypothetical protein